MLRRAVVLLSAALSVSAQVQAAQYIVRPGDTLSLIAQRYHVPLTVLARVNRIGNLDIVQLGRVLTIPTIAHTFYYHVRWGDTLIGIAAEHGITVIAIRAMNPQLGAYPLAGQTLKLCGPCSSGAAPPAPTQTSSSPAPVASSVTYFVQPGDNLLGIAARFGMTAAALMSANRIANPDLIVIGTRLSIPQSRAGTGTYDPWAARSLIASYAQQYGIEASLPLAVAWQESGFNQTLVSRTGAIGVMQVEPYTGDHIADLLGRSFNLYNLDDNIHAGVFWLAHLLWYYGGNERLAVAAYYEGAKSIDRYGFFEDTKQYVNDVMALKLSFGG